MSVHSELTFEPLVAARWADFETLFGAADGCVGCWCMWWKLKRADFDAGKGDANRARMKRIVDDGVVPGLLAYDGADVVGWCAVEPRENYPLLGRSRLTRAVDDQAVWFVTCLYVRPERRGNGITEPLLRAVIDHVGARGGRFVEGVAVEPRDGEILPAAWVSTGLPSTFRALGFTEMARRESARDRLIYRLAIDS